MKHFLANSNEDGRTSSSSDFDERNLREYYLVRSRWHTGGECAIVHGVVQRGQQDSRHRVAVHPDIVEKEWKFDGMVWHDAGSLPNLTRQFKYYPDSTAAVAGCVKAGITVFLDQYAAR